MPRLRVSRIAATVVLLGGTACSDTPHSRTAALTAPGAPDLSSSPDRTAPTAPGALRVTGTTSYSVSLAWSPSTDKSGQLTYHVISSGGGGELVLPQSQTTATWTTAVFPRNSYTFLVYAVDAAGNRSKNSNGVGATLPADTQLPSTPVVTATAVGPTYITLSAQSTDDGPIRQYLIFENGAQVGVDLTGGGVSITGLAPGSTHTFTAQAYDYAYNKSSVSAPITVTTNSVDPSDNLAPTTPSGLSAYGFGDLEIDLFWTASTDDRDPGSAIRYEVYLNGVLTDSMYNRTNSIVYGVSGTNAVSVVAVDGARNRSAPATTTVMLP